MKENIKKKRKKEIIPVLILLVFSFLLSFHEYNQVNNGNATSDNFVENNTTEDIISVENPISDIISIPQAAGYYTDLAEESTTSTSYVILKEIILTESAEVIQYSFDSDGADSSGIYVIIEINGAGVHSWGVYWSPYRTYTGVEIGNFPIGTTISLKIRSGDGAEPVYCKNFFVTAKNNYIDETIESTTSSSYVKMKEFTLSDPAENIQYSFESHSTPVSGHTCYITVDDGASMGSIGGAIADYATKTGNLTGNFPVGTKVQLWMRTWTGGPSYPAYCRNFFITPGHLYSDMGEESTILDYYVKMKEFVLEENANLIDYSFESHSTTPSGHTCYITIDDGAIMGSIGGAVSDYATKTGSLIGDFPVGTKVQLWMRTWTLTMAAYCRNFKISTYALPDTPSFFSNVETPCYDGTVRLSWNLDRNAITYQIMESDSSGGVYYDILEPTTNTFVDITKNSAQTMYYKIRASNFIGESVYEFYREITWANPSTPTFISPDPEIIYDDNFEIEWSDSVSHADEVNLQNSSDGINFLDIPGAITSPTALTGLGEGAYYFRVRATNGVGTVYSSVKNVNTSSPESFTISTNESICYDGQTQINWSAFVGGDTYQLQECNISNGIYHDLYTPTTNNYINITKTSNQTQYYKVNAINNLGDTLSTNYLEIHWLSPNVPTINTTSQTITNDEIDIVWNSTITGALEVNLQVSTNGSNYLDISGAITSPTPQTGLAEGIYYYRVRATNTIDTKYSSVVIITVDLQPIISEESDILNEYGSPPPVVSWTANDLFPDNYEITIPGYSSVTGNWTSGEPITTELPNLPIGTYTITCIIYDQIGNSQSASLNVIIQDTTAPTIDVVGENTYEIGTIGNIISWDIDDLNQVDFELFRNDTFLYEGEASTEISLITGIDGLPAGEHIYKLVVTDIYGNSAEATVIITVTDNTNGNTNGNLWKILSASGGVVVIAVVGIGFSVKKRKQ